MAKTSGLRKKLKDQRRGMSRGGVFIDNKTFSKMTLRILPCGGDVPGHKRLGFYAKDLKKSVTSPLTFGLRCPVMDARDNVFQQGTEDEKEVVKEAIRVMVEYYIPVIDRENPGDVNRPAFRILQARPTVYQAIVDYMLESDDDDDDEDNAEVDDVTDPVTGRDIRLRKKGQQLETEWICKFLDPSPIMPTEEEADAFVAAAAKFNAGNYIKLPDWGVLEEMYGLITGEAVPDAYEETQEALEEMKSSGTSVGTGPSEGEGDEDEGGDDDAAGEDDGDEDDGDEDDGGEESGDDDDAGQEEGGEVEFGETEVTFDDDGNVFQGVVIGEDEENTNNYDVQVGDDLYSVPKTAVVIVETEPEEAEPTAPPKAAKKKPAAAKKAPAKKASSKGKKGKAPNKPKTTASSKVGKGIKAKAKSKAGK